MRSMARHSLRKASTTGEPAAGAEGRLRDVLAAEKQSREANDNPHQNGTRQPQASTVAGIRTSERAPTAEPSRMPAWRRAAPRRRPPAARRRVSTRKTTDVVYSPPTDRPWIIRSSTSRTAAAAPIWSSGQQADQEGGDGHRRRTG